MEHPSHKSWCGGHDYSKCGCYCARRAFTGMKISKILVHIFYFAYFYHPCHFRLVHRQTRMVTNVAGIIVIPVDCFCVICMCISNELRASIKLPLSCSVMSKWAAQKYNICTEAMIFGCLVDPFVIYRILRNWLSQWYSTFILCQR